MTLLTIVAETQLGVRRLTGGRASVSRGSGVSPSPKLAKRCVNSESSPGSSGTSRGSGSGELGSAGVTSGSGSLGIRVQLPKESSARLRDVWLRFKDGAANPSSPDRHCSARQWISSCLNDNVLNVDLLPGRGLYSGGRRCCATTPTTAPLPQSARCQEPWHLSIQTVAHFLRSEPGCGALPVSKHLQHRRLLDWQISARVLLPGR